MKKKLLSLSAVALLFFASCNPRENIVTFYLDNQITEQLMLNAQLSEVGSEAVFSEKNIDLLESDTFQKYFLNIVELEITSLKITISEYDGGIENGTLHIGNSIVLDNLNMDNRTFEINDNQSLIALSRELLNRQIVPFSFEGESIAQDSFHVSVNISVKGAFTD